MFQSPLKTVSEKVKPVSSKSSISSVKFDRASDFKKFINFIKKETKELEKIKIPKVSEVKGKSKRKGFLGLAALGIFGLLGLGLGDDDGEEKKRFGLAGGTESQFKDIDLPLIRSLKRVQRVQRVSRAENRIRTRRFREALDAPKKEIVKKYGEDIKKFRKEKRTPLQRRLERRKKRITLRGEKIRILKNTLKDLKLKKEFLSEDPIEIPESPIEKFQRIVEEIKNEKDPEIKARLEKQLLDEVALPDPEFEKAKFAKYTDSELEKIEKLFGETEKQQKRAKKLQKKDRVILKEQGQKLRGMRNIRKTFEKKIDPNVTFGGRFDMKGKLDKMFTGIGQKTKTFRDSLSAGFSKIPIPKKAVSIAKPFLKKGAFVFDFATAGIELYKILEGFVVGDNILTSFYDLGVAIHNTFQPDKTKLITYITNSRNSRIKAITDQKNQEISNQIQQAQQAKASNNNVSPSNPTSNIIPFAKKTGMDAIMVPMYPQFTGFKFIMDKLYRQ